MEKAIRTSDASTPQGHYEQAIATRGEMIFVSGQTPRKTDGSLLKGATFTEMARQTMNNIAAMAHAAACNLPDHCVKVTVYLRDLEDRHDFDTVFAEFFDNTPPARAIVQSGFTDFSVEVDAILVN